MQDLYRMKIQMLVHLSGVGYLLVPGEITERFSDTEALRLVRAGYAAVVMGEPERERAIANPIGDVRAEAFVSAPGERVSIVPRQISGNLKKGRR